MSLKNILKITAAPHGHWVGDGFPVCTMFSYQEDGVAISPFLLLDYAGPREFKPASTPRGVGEHPHRGFETVTIMYQGEVEHKDNAGNAGKISVGDVQWMTAGKGVLHSEMHSTEFTQKGGMFEAVQLWVNLPAAHKMTPVAYQDIRQDDIPVFSLEEDAGHVRIISGEFKGIKGAARTFTPVNIWDTLLKKGGELNISELDEKSAIIFVLSGAVQVNNAEVTTKEIITLEHTGADIQIKAQEDSKMLILSGEPIDEPIAGLGPFVMNTQSEIRQAVEDFHSGKF